MPFWNEKLENRTPAEQERMAKTGLIPMRFIGVSAAPMRDQLEELRKRVFQGCPKVELGFWGDGKGGGSNTTPGMYGSDTRQDIKELAQINGLDLTTHVTPSIFGWAGYDHKTGSFDDSHVAKNMREVRRTVEFAQETTNGGAIVMHTGEWRRSIAGNFGHEGFEFYPGETDKAEHLFVHGRTGERLAVITEDQQEWFPEYEQDDQGNPVYFRNPDGTFMTDAFGDRIQKLKLDDRGEATVKSMTVKEFADREIAAAKEKGETLSRSDAVKRFYREQVKLEADKQIATGNYFGEAYFRGSKERDALEKHLDNLKELKKNLSKDQFDTVAKGIFADRFREDIDSGEDALKQIEKRINETQRSIEHGRESLLSARRAAAQMNDRVDNAEEINEFGMKKTAHNIGQLGYEMWERTLQSQKDDPNMKPFFIAPENIYPEQFGAHPQELKQIIQRSRDSMQKQLMQKEGLSAEEAEKLASTHIRATFDIGHVNTWWKYYNGSREEFKQWVLGQVQDLVDNDIIGHVHIADNFGYEDEHTTPGQGTAPIKEFAEILAKANITDMITEPAHQDILALKGAWNEFGDSIVHLDRVSAVNASTNGTMNPLADRWTNIQNSYFGQVSSPRFVVGDYAPSQEFRGSPFYMGVPLE